MGTWVCGFVGPDGAQWRTDANREVPHTHGPTHPVSRECRAPGSGGCRPGVRRFSFEARGAVAQLGERLDRTQEVRGSSPLSSIEKLPLGVIGNTPDSGSGESWFEPRRGNSKRDATMSRVALRALSG